VLRLRDSSEVKRGPTDASMRDLSLGGSRRDWGRGRGRDRLCWELRGRCEGGIFRRWWRALRAGAAEDEAGCVRGS